MNKSVLVVDDDDAIRDMLDLALSIEGYCVHTAENGQEALDILTRLPARVILLDLMMPVMDGWTFRSEQLRRKELADIPVIVLSATYQAQEQAESLRATAVLPKPFELSWVLSLVEDLTDRRDF